MVESSFKSAKERVSKHGESQSLTIELTVSLMLETSATRCEFQG